MITRYSGAMHDIQVWGLTQIYQNLPKICVFRKYFLGDSTYLPTKIMVSLYKEIAKNNIQNKVLNKSLSSVYINIDYALNIFKSRYKT